MTFITTDLARQSSLSLRVVRGRSVAHQNLSKAQRAMLGARIVLGEKSLIDLTQAQIARALGVSETAISAAVLVRQQWVAKNSPAA